MTNLTQPVRPQSPEIVSTLGEEQLDSELERLADTGRLRRIAFWVLGVGFGGFLVWSALVPLAEGVPTMGTVVIDTKRKPVQHPDGGVIAEVLVREGDMVTKDQLLIRLGSISARAAHETVVSELASLRENLASQRTAIDGYREVRIRRKQQMALLQTEYEGLKGLVEEGYAPANQKRDLERRISELSSNLVELDTAEERAGRSVNEINFRLTAALQRLKVTERDLEFREIKAPAEGQVIGLQFQTPGSVIQPAQKLMDIVPAQEELVLETKVEPQLIDRVAPNDPVDIRFSSFSHSPQLVLPGQVISISQDVLTDEKTGAPYYLARVRVAQEGLSILGNRRMQPGMPVEVIIKTGSRTLLAYLVHPLVRRISSSMKEE